MAGPTYPFESSKHLSDSLGTPRSRGLEERQALDLEARRLGVRSPDQASDPNWMENLMAQEEQRRAIYPPVDMGPTDQDWLEFWKKRAGGLHPRRPEPLEDETRRTRRFPLRADQGLFTPGEPGGPESVPYWEQKVATAERELAETPGRLDLGRIIGAWVEALLPSPLPNVQYAPIPPWMEQMREPLPAAARVRNKLGNELLK